jgi:hypothetical protein
VDLLTERTVAAQRRTLGRDAGTAAGCPGIMSFNSRPCPARSVRPVRRPAPPGSRMPPRVTPRFIEPGGYRAGSGPGRARARLRLFFPVTPPPPTPHSPSSAPPHRLQQSSSARLGLSNCADRNSSNQISLAFLKGCMEISPELLGQILHRLHSSAWNENCRPGIRIQSQVKGKKRC